MDFELFKASPDLSPAAMARRFKKAALRTSAWLIPARFPEPRLAALLIAIIEIMWALLPMVDPLNPIKYVVVLMALPYAPLWLTGMASIGAMLALTSVLPWRSGRHIALFLSSSAFFSTFGFFTHNWAATPGTMALPVLGLYCLVLLAVDVWKKPREWR